MLAYSVPSLFFGLVQEEVGGGEGRRGVEEDLRRGIGSFFFLVDWLRLAGSVPLERKTKKENWNERPCLLVLLVCGVFLQPNHELWL